MSREQEAIALHQVVREAIDSYARYYAEHHKLGLSIRADMQYIAEVATRWARESDVVRKDAERYRWLRDMGIVAEIGQPFVAYWQDGDPMPISGGPLDRELDAILERRTDAFLSRASAESEQKATERDAASDYRKPYNDRHD